jgi:hypothetical protein
MNHSDIKQIFILTIINDLYVITRHTNMVKLSMKHEIFLHYFLINL